MNNIEDNAYSVISKLDFTTLQNSAEIIDTFKDENMPSLFTWDVSDRSNISVSESNGVKVISLKSNNAGVYAQSGKYLNPSLANLKTSNYEIEMELEIENVNSGNIYFGLVGTNNGVIIFNFTNKLIGGFEIFSNGRHVKFNYQFLAKTKYNVMVTRNVNIYTLYVDGLCIGSSSDAKTFNDNININDFPTLTIGKAQPASNDNDQFKGKVYGYNYSFNGAKYNRSFSKYGEHLVSRYNFLQLGWDGALTTTRPRLEAVYNSPFNWTLDNSITSGTDEWYLNKSNKFVSNISDIFTIQFGIKNTKNVNCTLADMGSYKLEYSFNRIGEPEPEVIVNENTISAIDFEDGMTDKKGIVWNVWNGSGAQSGNVIYGSNSLQIKQPLNSYVDTTNLLIKGDRPFTLDFYALIQGSSNDSVSIPLYSQSFGSGGGEQFYQVANGKLAYSRAWGVQNYAPYTDNYNISRDNIRLNEINKYTMTYDGSATRIFLNDTLQAVYGTGTIGWWNTNARTYLMHCLVSGYEQYQFGGYGLIDNLNIFENECRITGNKDEYEDYLVCDLQMEGRTGTINKMIDNAPSKPTWTLVNNGGNYSYTKNDFYDTGTTYFYKNSYNSSGLLSQNVDMNFGTDDFTLQFEITKSSDTLYCNFICSGVTNYGDQQQYPNLWYFGLFGSGYTGNAPLSKKLSFFNEKYLDENKDTWKLDPFNTPNILVSKTIIEVGKRYKVEVVKKSGFMYLYINNKLDNVVAYPMPINLSPTGLGTSIGYIPFSNEAGLIGSINYVKAYKGIAIFPKYSKTSNRLSLDLDNNTKDMTGDYWHTKNWNVNNTITYSENQYESINGYSMKTGDSTNSYINSGKNDLLNYGNINFDISFDVKNIKPDNENGLEVVVASGETSFTANNTEIQVVGFHYQSNESGSVTKQNELKSQIYFGYNFNNKDYLQGVKTVRNTFYNVNQLRIGNALVQKVNDVVCNVTNFNINLPINLNKADNTYIGKCLWRGNDVGTGADSQFKGFIDNFKSIKDDLTRDISIFSSTSKSIVENRYNYLTLAPNAERQSVVVQLDDMPHINRGTIEVECFVHNQAGTIIQLCVGNGAFTTVGNEFGLLLNITCDETGKFTSQVYNEQSQIVEEKVISLNKGTIGKVKIEMLDTGTKFYLNDILLHSVSNVVLNKSSLAIRNYMSPYPDLTTKVYVKSVKVLNSLGAEIYYRDWKTSIENTIDRPTIDIPFIKSSLNLGTSKVAIDSYFAFPTYDFYQGRDCIKFNNQDIRLSSANTSTSGISDNPFDFGEYSDFYIEMDFFIENNSTNKAKYHTLLSDGNGTDVNRLGGFLGVHRDNGTSNTNKVYFRRLLNEDILFLSSKTINFGVWNNLKFYRKDTIVYMELNGDVVSSYIKTIQFYVQDTYIGRSRFDASNYLIGAISNFIVYSGRSDKPENYDSKEVLNIDFSPTRKSYLFKDKFNKHVIHPVNIKDREYIDSKYGVRLNGVDQNIQLGQSNMLNFGNNSDFIMKFEFNYDTSNANVNGAVIMACANTGWTNGSLYIVVGFGDNLNKITMGMYGYADTFSSSNLVSNGYNKLIIYRQNNLLKMILNDQETINQPTAFNTANLNFNMNNNTLIGKSGWSATDNFKGVIHSVKIFRDTADLSLLDDSEGTSFEEKYILTNGTDSQDVLFNIPVESKEIQITSDSNLLTVQVDDNKLEVPKTTPIDNIKLMDGFGGSIKDLRVYNNAFLDKDEYVGTVWSNTTFPEVEIADDVEELIIYDIGDDKIIGFIEGYTDRKFVIYNTANNYVMYEGIEDYEFEADINYFDDYEVQDLVNGQKYPLYKHEMIKGFIGGTVNLESCGVSSSEMKVYCFRNDNNRFIGVYDIDSTGKYNIPNLDVNSFYDIVFKTVDRKLENISSSYRKPKQY